MNIVYVLLTLECLFDNVHKDVEIDLFSKNITAYKKPKKNNCEVLWNHDASVTFVNKNININA